MLTISTHSSYGQNYTVTLLKTVKFIYRNIETARTSRAITNNYSKVDTVRPGIEVRNQVQAINTKCKPSKSSVLSTKRKLISLQNSLVKLVGQLQKTFTGLPHCYKACTLTHAHRVGGVQEGLPSCRIVPWREPAEAGKALFASFHVSAFKLVRYQ